MLQERGAVKSELFISRKKFAPEVATNATGRRLQRVGSAEHGAALFDGIEALPDHGHDRAARHVRDEIGKELLVLEIAVVLL